MSGPLQAQAQAPRGPKPVSRASQPNQKAKAQGKATPQGKARAQAQPSLPIPRTAAEALAQYDKVQNGAEAQRRRAVQNLGRFQDPRITRILLAESQGAKLAALRQAAIRALGQRPRQGALPILIEVFEAQRTTFSLRNAAVSGIGRQGEAGVDYLLRKLKTIPRGSRSGNSMAIRNAVIQGLAGANTPRALNAVAAESMRGKDPHRNAVLVKLRGKKPTARVTEARLKAAKSSFVALASQGVLQLAEQGHKEASALALSVFKRHRATRGFSKIYISDLVRAMVRLLDDKAIYEPFLEAAAAAGTMARRPLEQVTKGIDKRADFVDWLLRQGLKHDDVRARLVAVRLLSGSTDERITEVLGKLAQGREPGVARAAIQALGRRKDPAGIDSLRQVLRGSHKGRKLDAIHSLHKLCKDDPKWKDDLVAMLDASGEEQKIVALDLLVGYEDRMLLPRVYRELLHKSWRVRSAAMDYCRKVRSRKSVPHLIACLEKARGRMWADCQMALRMHTGFRLHTAEAWRRWWAENKDSFQLPPLEAVVAKAGKEAARPAATVVSYFNLSLVSDRVIFVVDVSGSMGAMMGGVPPAAGTQGGGAKDQPRRTRIEEAKVQLNKVILALPKDARFNLIYFETLVRVFLPRMALAGKGMKRRAVRSVLSLQPRGGTNIHDAMDEAFADPHVDTIYLLSDGSPNGGRITDVEELADEIAQWNQTRRIRIHTIALGSKSRLLERLAAESGGRHTWMK